MGGNSAAARVGQIRFSLSLQDAELIYLGTTKDQADFKFLYGLYLRVNVLYLSHSDASEPTIHL